MDSSKFNVSNLECTFCKNTNTNHSSEEHMCKKCGVKGLHSYKNCKVSGLREVRVSHERQRTVVPAVRTRIPTVRAAPTGAALTRATQQKPNHFKYNNLFRMLVTMIPTAKPSASVTPSTSASATPSSSASELASLRTSSQTSKRSSPRASSKWSPIVKFNHNEVNFTVDFTIPDQVESFFDNMYTDSKIITVEFVKAFMENLSRIPLVDIPVDLNKLYIELFKNFYTVDTDDSNTRYYVKVV